MFDLKYCKLCLATDVKMSKMNHAIHQAYSNLIRLPLFTHEPYICYECAALLRKYNVFYTRCHTAHTVLTAIQKNSKITKQAVKAVNREQSNLETKLSQSLTSIVTSGIEGKEEYQHFVVIKNEFTDSTLHEDTSVTTDAISYLTLEYSRDTKQVQKSDNNLAEHKSTDHNGDKVELRDDINSEEIADTSFTDTDNDDIPVISKVETIEAPEEDCLPNKDTNVDNAVSNISVKYSGHFVDDKFSSHDVSPKLNTTKPKIGLKNSKSTKKKRNNIVKPKSLPKIKGKPLKKCKKENIKANKKSRPVKKSSNIIKDGGTELGKIKDSDSVAKTKASSSNNQKSFEDLMRIEVLSPTAAKEEILNRKESSNYIQSIYKCEFCFKGYQSVITFGNHIKKHSAEFGDLQCWFCNMRFSNKTALKRHTGDQHTYKYHCQSCPFVSSNRTNAKSHLSIHSGKKYVCAECGDTFNLQHSLLNHRRKRHMTESVCALCGSGFASARGLALHMTLVHKLDKIEVNGPKCEECDIQFATDAGLKRHHVLSLKHKHKISNGCSVCGETFDDKNSLRKHVDASHSVERRPAKQFPAACNICNQWLKSYASYLSHMKAQHIKPGNVKKSNHMKSQDEKGDKDSNQAYICEVCGKVLKNRQFLIYHVRNHTGERPCKCSECGKSFSNPVVLSSHRATHRPRPGGHPCEQCHKVFANRTNLTIHRKRHHLGILPHKCDICGRGFSYACELRLHVKHSHDKVPWPKPKPEAKGTRNMSRQPAATHSVSVATTVTVQNWEYGPNT